MLKNYIVITFRNLIKTKVYSLINLLGLSIGIGICFLIILYVKDEITFDKFHSKADRVYRAYTESFRRGEARLELSTPFIMGPTLKENHAEIEEYTVYTGFGDIVKAGDVSFNERMTIVSPGFFKMFDFEIINGSYESIFSNPNETVITKEISEKYFGTSDAVGKILNVSIGGEYTDLEVKAVTKNVPSNSSLTYDILVSDHFLKPVYGEGMLTHWFAMTGDTYVMLKEGADYDGVIKNFETTVDAALGERLKESNSTYAIQLQPLKEMHLDIEKSASNTPVNDPKYIYILGAIGFLILIMATINFTNLSLARSLQRAREIGIRKSVGASRKQIFFQFTGEAIFLSLISLIMGGLMAYLTLEYFNEMSGKNLIFEMDASLILIFIGLGLLTGFIAGFYPSAVMSGFNTLNTIKGKIGSVAGKGRLRLTLVGIQFIVSIFMITSAVIMKSQLSYLQNKNLGFDKEQVVVIPINVSDAVGIRGVISKGMEKAAILKDQISSIPEIESTTIASHTFEPGTWTRAGYSDSEENQFEYYYNVVDPNYVSTMKIEIATGRDFDEENESDAVRSILVNEAFTKEFNVGIGDRIPNDRAIDHEIIGVVKDFHVQSLHQPIQSLVLSVNPEIGFSGINSLDVGSSESPKIFARIQKGKIPETLKEIEKRWYETYENDPFDYNFVDEQLKEQYEQEQSMDKIVTSATFLAILIGSLGLFGLATLIMNSKLKEVSIRKVLGASESRIMWLLTKDFSVLIVISLIISAPFTYYFMNGWLSDFEYKIVIGPQYYLIAGVIILGISFLTVLYQSLKTAHVNPVDNLKED